MSSSNGGEKFLISALVVSVAVHIGLMLVIRPQTLTMYSDPIRHAIHRRTMEMRDAREIPDAIRMAVLKDLAPLRESPEASSEALIPTTSSLDSSETDGVTPPIPADPELAVPPQPIVEVAPKFSESLRLADVPSFVTPLVAETGFGLTPPVSHPTPVTAESTAPTAAPEVDVPQFAVPDLPAITSAQEIVAPPEPTADPARTDGASDFTPPQQVMTELDEHVVAQEKAAVRDLLNVKEARELSKFVSVAAHSAVAGEWTYYRVKVAPLDELKPVPKDVVILMDASGSIANDRLKSCRAAAKEILRTCTNTGDRFNLVAFRDDFEYAFSRWHPCDQPSFAAADIWMARLAAHGRTDVYATIASVLKLPRDPKRPLIALVVTDGDANTGVSKTEEILSKFSALNDGLISVYMYGVKSSANRELIDVLTHGNRGESFIYDGNRKYAGRNLEDLSLKFRDPVLSDLRVVFAAGSKAEAYPRLLKNLYRGESVEIVGRVPTGTREVSFSLKGLNGSRAYEGFFKVNLGAAIFDPALPGEWTQERTIDGKLR